MALQAASSSTCTVLRRDEGIPSTKQMLRSTSQRFKQSSSLLQEAIQVHEVREKELLSTIQKLQEQIEKFQTSQEELEGKHQTERLMDRKKICELTRGIESFSDQLKPMSDHIKQTCEKTVRCQDQVDLCREAAHLRWVGQTRKHGIIIGTYISGYNAPQSAEILRKRLDPEYQARVNVDSPVPLFAKETKSYARSVQGKLEMILEEFGALEKTSKKIAQELKESQV